MDFDGECRRLKGFEWHLNVSVAGIDAGASLGPVTAKRIAMQLPDQRIQRRFDMKQTVAPGAEQTVC